MKNKCLALIKKKKFEIKEERIKKLKKNQVLIKISNSGICGSDLHYYRNGGLGSRNDTFPLYLGHETSGIVEDRNKNYGIKNYKHYAIDPIFFSSNCKHNDFNMIGKCGFKANLCPHSFYLGANTKGSFREYLIVDKNQLVEIDNLIESEYGFIVEPAAIALYSILRSALPKEKKYEVLVLGVGAIGLLQSSILSKAFNCNVTTIDKLEYRRNISKNKFGAKNTFSSIKEYLLNSNKKFDYVFDNIFTSKILNEALIAIKPQGKYIIIGIPETDYILTNPHLPRIKEIDFINVRRSNLDFKFVIDFMIHFKIDYKNLLTHRFKIEEHKKAFQIASNYKENIIRASIS